VQSPTVDNKGVTKQVTPFIFTYLHSICIMLHVILYCTTGKAGDLDHSWPDMIDHLKLELTH